MEARDEEIELEPRAYYRKPYTRPANKLRTILKENINPKLEEVVIVDEDEQIVKVSKSRKNATK